jgi:hypothetical protein
MRDTGVNHAQPNGLLLVHRAGPPDTQNFSSAHGAPFAAARRVPTGRTETSGPSTSTVWFVC